MDKKRHIIASGSRILMLFIVMIMAVSMVSALDFDNVKTYDKVKKEITIDNSFGLGKTLAKYKLISNTDQCLIDCSAEGIAVLSSEDMLFRSMKFKDKADKEKEINFKILIEKTKTINYQEDITKEVCNKIVDKNGTTTSCINEVIGKEDKVKVDIYWEEYKGEILKAGEYKWRIEGKKRAGESVDWIGNAFGKELTEWAWWNGDWSRKKEVLIQNLNPVQYNYSMGLTITYDADMKEGFDDLRFSDATETTELYYWNDIGKSVNSSSGTIFVKIPTLTATANTTIYMYYDNPNATTNSNMTGTFIVGDDFNDNSLNANWKQTGAVVNLVEQNGRLNITYNSGSNTAIFFNRSIEEYQNYTIYSTLFYSGNVDAFGLLGRASNDGGGYAMEVQDSANTLRVTEWSDAPSYAGTLGTVSFNNAVPLEWNQSSSFIGTGITGRITSAGTTLNISVSDETETGKFIGFRIPLNSGATGNSNYIYMIGNVTTFPTITFGAEELNVGISVTNSFPNNNTNFSASSISFGCNLTGQGSTNIASAKLNVTGTATWTQSITGLNTPNYNATFTNTTLADGTYNWNCIGYGDDGNNGSSAIWTLNKDATKPYFTLNYLTNATTTSLPANLTLSVTTTDTNRQACWYSADAGVTNTTYTCDAVFNVSYATGGLKTIYVYANDSFGNQNQTSYVGSVYYFNVTQSGSASTGEGVSETFTLLVNSTSSPIGDASATLVYNGVNVGVTSKTAVGINGYLFSKTYIIPSGIGNSTGKGISWYWNYNATQLTTRNTATQTQTVYNVSISDCEVLGGYAIMNLTLKDEELNTLVNITTPNTANIEIDLSISSLVNGSQTWDFAKQWLQNNTVSICVPTGLLTASEYRVDIVVGYDTSDRVREFFYLDNGTLDNSGYFNSYTPTVIPLMDLASADSTTFLFEYTDANDQKVDDIIVHTFRKYIGEGVFREVERSKQDNAGQTHVHLVEEDVIYYFMISQYGNILFTSDTYNAKCLSSPCEITLSASPSDTNWSIIDNEGGQYSVSTDKDTRIVTTSFSLDQISTVNASVYRYYGGNANLINTSSLTATSGSIDVFIPLVYDNSTFFVVIYNDEEVVKSTWISLEENGRDYFGTLGAILSGLIVLAMMLMAVSEGAGFVVFAVLSVIIVGVMQLVDLGALAIISIICMGGIIIWKLISRRGSRQ